MAIKGTELFVKALRAEGVDTVFGYPGGMAIDLFDALYSANDIDVILPRHEQALIHEADGYARATGKVGVCLVTSGRVQPILLQVLQPPILTVFPLCVLQDRYQGI